jgi:hypothetical protein
MALRSYEYGIQACGALSATIGLESGYGSLGMTLKKATPKASNGK